MVLVTKGKDDKEPRIPMKPKGEKSPLSITLETAEVDPKTGKPIGAWIQLATHSWTKAFAQFLQGQMSGDSNTIKETDATSIVYNNANRLDVEGTVTDDNYGILVGTNNTAVDKDDFALGTVIAEGSGSGQLNYQGTTVQSIAAITGGYRIVVERQLNNNSGGQITVEEVGLVAAINSLSYILIAHDLTGSVAIADAAARVFRYKIDILV